MDYLKMPKDGKYSYVLVAVDLYTRFTFAWTFTGEPNAETTITR